ncbi:hypothetical protein NQ318_018599 [Aromia moschata]|uniref:Uncharacterized protein n=1 Tax=Aromia moschata TaxID=1265417 RepID=A0AAV8ZFR1_9CUCU|nr:hypothetical protein NQ318_018599 [Aromia moschata]
MIANLYPAEGNPQLPDNAIWSQQDGAPVHYESEIRRSWWPIKGSPPTNSYSWKYNIQILRVLQNAIIPNILLHREFIQKMLVL